ncbi:MAG: carboxy terminal-processing peptidase [Rhodothermaceae bacterium]
MKNILLALVILLASSSCKAQTRDDIIEQNAKIDTNAVILPTEDLPTVGVLITKILDNHHFRENNINDSLSSVIFDNFIKALDNNKMYFLENDIAEFENFRFQLDNDLFKGNLEAPYEIFNIYKKRLTNRIEKIKDVLAHDFDFTKKEFFIPNRKEETWPKTMAELDEVWRKRLKNEALNLKLAKKETEKIKDILNKRYQSYHKIILQYRAEDVFQLFVNSFGLAIDPHTSYMSAKTSEDFKIDMSKSLEGIGATLRYKDDYTTVVSVVPGGPAFKSGQIKADDKIVSVGQGEDGEMVDVIGWRTDDTVLLIRGKKGTKVRLELLPGDSTPDMPTKTVLLVRDKVKLEEQKAQKEIIEIEENGKISRIGVIKVPSFYADFEARARGDKDYTSTTRDVKRLLNELKADKVDGVLVDMRNNGGGALTEAIELTGLFIKDGPVVQVKNSNRIVEVGQDPDPEIVYGGPLAVLVNKYSASATEIFSGAIQDYERGIVIGNTTHGKGTVQSLIDLRRFIRNPKHKPGQIKLTIAKYYRITGSSTQHKGVVPDIHFPDLLDASEYGESSYPSALPWDLINATNFTKFGELSAIIPQLEEKHSKRILDNHEFQYIMEDIEYYRENKDKKSFSLNEDVRKAEREKMKKKREKRDEERALRSNIKVPQKDEVKKKVKNLRVDDPFLEESGHILSNFISSLKK